MKSQNYHTSIYVNATTQQAFDAINNVTGWWTENLEGNSRQLNDEFSVRFGEVHYSKQKLTEFIPAKKVVWLVTDSRLNFVSDQQEWNNTSIIFDITEKDGQVQVTFTHEGLAPEVECYKDCSNAWSGYIQGSLKNLIDTGKGNPTKKETAGSVLEK